MQMELGEAELRVCSGEIQWLLLVVGRRMPARKTPLVH